MARACVIYCPNTGKTLVFIERPTSTFAHIGFTDDRRRSSVADWIERIKADSDTGAYKTYTIGELYDNVIGRYYINGKAPGIRAEETNYVDCRIEDRPG